MPISKFPHFLEFKHHCWHHFMTTLYFIQVFGRNVKPVTEGLRQNCLQRAVLSERPTLAFSIFAPHTSQYPSHPKTFVTVVALNCAELDYKSATTLNLISPILFSPSSTFPWPFAPDISSRSLHRPLLFLWDSTPLRPSSNIFMAQMSFLVFNPPFCPASSGGAFGTQWPASLTRSPSHSHFLAKTLSASEGEIELFPL